MKKKVRLLTGAVLLSLSGFCQTLSNQLEACYGLAGDANDPVNNLNGTLGAVTPDADRNGTANECYYFSGNASSLITLPDDSKLKGKSMSVSAWVKPSVINSSYIVFAKNNFSAFHEAYALSMDGTKFLAAKCNSSGNSYQHSATIPVANTWYHVVLCVSKTTLSLYVNGVLESTDSTTGDIQYQTGKGVQVGGSGESYFPRAFQGNIDNVRFYSRILSAQEVSDLYTLDPPCASSTVGGPPDAGPGPGPTPVNSSPCITGAKSWDQGGNNLAINNTIGTCDNIDFILKANNQSSYMSHSLLNGELAKGKHPALISEEVFFRANDLKKVEGFKSFKANDNLPLKTFVRDAESGIPFTGYLVRKKGLYYYKVNKTGVCINRSVKLMHEKFRQLLAYYTINSTHIEPLKVQLQYTWDNLTETNTSEKKGLSLQLSTAQEEYRTLRKRHALGEISLDVYTEFAGEMEAKIKALSERLAELEQNLSNPKELINYTCKLASNLVKIWDLGDYYQKVTFQKTLFPSGLGYDAKNDNYRTSEVNSVFALITKLSKDYVQKENGNSQNFIESSRLVAGDGFEPPTFGL